MKSLTENQRALLAEATRLGVANAAIIKRRGHHPRLIGSVKGSRFAFPVGSSRPGDWRAYKNARAGLRRIVRQLDGSKE